MMKIDLGMSPGMPVGMSLNLPANEDEHRSLRLDSPDLDRTITVRLADDSGARNDARMLVNRMYAWRGYGDRHVIPIAPTHATFTASDDEQTVGTITLAIDSADGLAADKIFRDEIDVFRRVPGAKVCELTKLAFDAEVPSKPLLASLFHIVFIYGQRRHRCTDLFIEVNPRHRRFYEAMLGFQPIGEPKTNESVGAPSQLMWLQVSKIREQIDRHARRPGIVARSLYQFFFSPREEDGIYARLAGPDVAVMPPHIAPLPCESQQRSASA
jgi:hypothetical protein